MKRLVPTFPSSYTISTTTFYELRRAMGTCRLRCRDFKSAALVLTVGLLLMAGPLNADDGTYWVVGNRATQRCDIVTSNPVIYGLDAYNHGYWFGSGPYRSRDDAKLARSTITACPKVDPDDDK